MTTFTVPEPTDEFPSIHSDLQKILRTGQQREEGHSSNEERKIAELDTDVPVVLYGVNFFVLV
jgi:hypothetical protein